MTAEEYLELVCPLFGFPARGPAKVRDPAVSFFLSLPERFEAAAGKGHFLESAADTVTGLDRVKLALIAQSPREGFESDPARDDPKKAEVAARLIPSLSGGNYDSRRALGILGLLGRWKMRGSLMISLDFERKRGVFGKLSFYAYLPGADRLPELLALFGLSDRLKELSLLSGASLGFFGADFEPTGGCGLKFYNKSAYGSAPMPEALAAVARGVSELGEVRDVTRLTRVPAGDQAGGDTRDKIYLGFSKGIGLGDLARVRALGEHREFFRNLDKRAPGQYAYFLGFREGAFEVYFDRRKRQPQGGVLS